MLIGLDLDNTIIRYERSILAIGSDMGIDFSELDERTKKALRDRVRGLPNGESIWQTIQAKVYGSELDKAELSKGFKEFCFIAKLRGYNLCVVSHKTDISHADPLKILLRVAANRWLDNHGFFHKLGFRIDQIHYCATQNEKIRKIQSLGCEVFVDDLTELFENPLFPQSTRKIHFNPGSRLEQSKQESCRSWREITKALFGIPQPDEILAVARQICPEISFATIEGLPGRGNSKVFKVPNTSEGDLFLKIYPDQEMDDRRRMKVEFSALESLHINNLPVPRPVRKSEDLDWALYEWIPGNNPSKFCSDFLQASGHFLNRLNCLSRTAFGFLQAASEACTSGHELEGQITRRLLGLELLCDPLLSHFLENTFRPLMTEGLSKAKLSWPRAWDSELDAESCVLSPSDFGTHNCHVSNRGEFRFFDFEYFGLDDPVKLLCDLFWHPGMPDLFGPSRLDFVKTIANIYRRRYPVDSSLDLAIPLFGLRWILILLNEFHPHLMQKRIQAQGLTANPDKIKEGKLALAGRFADQVVQTLRSNLGI